MVYHMRKAEIIIGVSKKKKDSDKLFVSHATLLHREWNCISAYTSKAYRPYSPNAEKFDAT